MRLLLAVVVAILLMTSFVHAEEEQWADDTLSFGIALYDTLGYAVGGLDSVAVTIVDPMGRAHIATNKSLLTWVGDSSYTLTNIKIRKRPSSLGTPNQDQDTAYIGFVQKSSICTTATRFGTYQIVINAHSADGLSGGKWTQTVIPFVVGGVESRLSDAGIRYLRDSLFFTVKLFNMLKCSVVGVYSGGGSDSTQMLVNHTSIPSDSTFVGSPVCFYYRSTGYTATGVIRKVKRITNSQDSIWLSVPMAADGRPKAGDSCIIMRTFAPLYRQNILAMDSGGVNVTKWNSTAVATPATAGIPDVNVKNIDNDAASASATVTFPTGTIANTTNITAGTVTTATNVTTVNGLAANTLTASALATDAVQELEAAIYAKEFTTTDTSLRIKLIDGTGANPDTVLTRTGAAASVTSLPDSVQKNIARHVWERASDTTQVANSFGDTLNDIFARIKTNLDSATSKVGIGDNAIGSTELAVSANQEIDSGVWHSRVDTVTPDSSAGKVLYKAKVIKDTTSTRLDVTLSSRGTSNLVVGDNIGVNFSDISGTLDSTEVGEGTYQQIAKRIMQDTTKRIPMKGGSGTDSLRSSVGVPSGMSTLTTSDNIGINLSDVSGTLDSTEIGEGSYQQIAKRILQDTTKRVKFSNDSVVAIDPVRSVTLSGTPNVNVSTITDGAIATADFASGATIPRVTLVDSAHKVGIGDNGINANGLAITAVQELEAAQYAKTFTTSDTSLRIKLIDGTGANPDTVLTRTAAGGSSVDTALLNYYIRKGILGDTSKRIFSGLFSDTSKRVGFKGGSGDSVKVVGNVSTTVDTASLARSVWDNDIVARANRTIDEVDTVYNTVICNDTVGGDFLLTLADYRAQIKHKMGVGQTNTTWLTDSVLNQLVREAIVTVNPIMRGYKTSITRVTRFDSSDYPIDSLVGISSVVWHKDDTARSIPYLAKEKWATLATQNTYGGDDPYLERPQVYDYTDAVISFFPVPTSEDTIQINGWAKIPNITVISAVSQIPQKYRVAVLKYASFLVARAKQHPLIQTFLDEYHESVAFLMAGNNAQTPSK